MIKSILITGANSGLGKESARQLALKRGVEKIYLGCRNEARALEAKKDLEKLTGKNVFDILIMDTSNLTSVRNAVKKLPEPVEGLIMNAGGAVGKSFNDKTIDGVTEIFAANVLGHVALTEELIKANKLTRVAVYAGSEAARGVPEMGMKKPDLKTSSVEEFKTIIDGSFFGNNKDPMVPYGPIKLMAALWMSSIARTRPSIRFVTMSPGGTTGTEGISALPVVKRVVFKGMFKLMSALGKMHTVDVGAKRYVDGLLFDKYPSGSFYASKKGMSGAIATQGSFFDVIDNHVVQDNATKALQSYL